MMGNLIVRQVQFLLEKMNLPQNSYRQFEGVMRTKRMRVTSPLPGDLIREPDRLGSDRILSESDENRKDPIGIYRIPGNESTNGTLVSESLQDPTVGKTKETDYRNLSDPTKQTL